MKILLRQFENMWYFKTHTKEYDDPGSCETYICSELNMKIDDYQKEMEKFNGENHAFGVTYELDSRGEIHSLWNHDEHAMSFRNKSDAEVALEWIEAQMLAQKMSESLYDKNNWSYGHLWVPPTLINKTTKKQLAKFKVATNELTKLGKEHNKCVSGLWLANKGFPLQNTSEDTLLHKAISSDISLTNVLLTTLKPSMSQSLSEEMELSLDLHVSLMKSRSSASITDTSDSSPILKKIYPMWVKRSEI